MPTERARGDFLIPDTMPENIYQEHIGRYELAASLTTDKNVLDIACGAGYGSNYLRKKGARMVVGGDVNRDAIKHAKAHYKMEGLFFLRLDAMNFPFPKRIFDVVVSLETIEHLKNSMRFISACKEALKKDGLFICSTPNSLVTSSDSFEPLNPFHVCEFTMEEFHNLLCKHFENVVIYVQDFLTLRQIFMYRLYGSVAGLLSLTLIGRRIRDVIWETSMDIKNLIWKNAPISSVLSMKPLRAKYKAKLFKNDLAPLHRVAHILAIAQGAR